MLMSKIMHFHVGDGINDIVRDAYWLENRQKFANEVLECFMGITIKQKRAIIRCKSRLIPTKDKKRMTFVDESEKCLKSRYQTQSKFVQPKNKITNNSGWLMSNGDFYPCEWMGHVDKSADVYDRENMINIKDDYFNMYDLHCDNSELWIENTNAIKLTNHKIMFGTDRIITQEQLDRLSEYLEEGNKLTYAGIEFVYKKQMIKTLRERASMLRRRLAMNM